MGKLPKDVLAKRLRNELRTLCDYLGAELDVDDDAFYDFPIEVTFKMRNVPGKAERGSRIVDVNEHSFRLIIDDDYPFNKPKVRWASPIFHPNIMDPTDGGHVCIKLLDTWTFNSSLLSFVRGVEHLVMNPNPLNPFGTESCLAASKAIIDADGSRRGNVVTEVCRR